MRFSLIYPPDSLLPTAPFASLAVVSSVARKSGHSVKVRDLNLEAFDILTRAESLDSLRAAVQAKREALESRPSHSAEDEDQFRRLHHFEMFEAHRFDQVPHFREVMSGDKFFQPHLFTESFDSLRSLWDIILGLAPEIPIADVPQMIESEELWNHDYLDPIDELMATKLVPSVLADEPEIVGVTIPYFHTLTRALKFLRILKRQAPEIPVVIGGATLEAGGFRATESLSYFKIYDYVVEGEADIALPNLLETLEKGGDLSQVPNLSWLENEDTVRTNPKRVPQDLNALPTPDFTQLPLDGYLLPYPVASFLTSRGCYFGRCKFCAKTFRDGYRRRDEKLVLEDMIKIHEQTGIRYFQFWDSLAPPRTLHYLATEIKRRELDFYWMAETRFETQYADPEFVKVLSEGHCRYLHFGFESGSPRLLQKMDKGQDLDRVSKILKNLEEAGIQAGVFWFIGYPTETPEEAHMSYNFIAQRRSAIAVSAFTGPMRIGTDMIVFQELDELGIEVIPGEGNSYDYQFKDGTPHYDWTEPGAAFISRRDYDFVMHSTQLLFATVAPSEAERISRQHRLGPLSHQVRLDDPTVTFRRYPGCHLKSFSQAPGRLGTTWYLRHPITGHIMTIEESNLPLWRALQSPHNLLDLARQLGESPSNVRSSSIHGINRGFIRILCSPDQVDFSTRHSLHSLAT